MPNVAEKIIKAREGFDLKKIEKAVNFIGGDSIICMQHLKLILSLHPDEASLLVYLLHEYVIDAEIPIKKIEKTFGREVAEMIVNINAVFALRVNKNTQPEILRKMFLTLAKDFRVVIVLLVNKLAEMEHGLKNDNPLIFELCRTAMDIYVPIATRLGIYTVKSLMEDVCFQVLHPEDFARIKKELLQYEKISDKYIGKATQSLRSLLDENRINAEISGRMKHPYSIYKKMQRKQKINVGEIFDIFALRIVLDEDGLKGDDGVAQCYSVLGLIHGKWKPIARRFKDYISVPKVNGYRSLHTTILGLTPDVCDEPTEVQIRTRTMHEEAEFGLASHWWYKEAKKGHTVVKDSASDLQSKRVQTQIEWLKGIADLHKELEGDSEGIAISHALDLFSDQIFALTPKGDVLDLPQGATPVDFAYMIHTDVGNRCVQAKVNGLIVPLDSELNNGDVVQILMKKDAIPSRYWLSFVKTHSARYRIKAWFRDQDRENNLRVGKDLLNKELTKLNKPSLDPGLNLLKIYDGHELAFKEREFILECLGNGHFSTKQVLKKILSEDELLTEKNIKPVKFINFKEFGDSDKGGRVVISGEKDIPINFASCCTPMFGAPIVGYVGRGQSIRIHAQDCDELAGLEVERLIPVEWESVEGYYVTLEIKTDDSPEVGSLIWEKLKQFETDKKELSTVAKVSDGVVRRLFIKVKDLGELQDIMQKIEHVEGVADIRKVS